MNKSTWLSGFLSIAGVLESLTGLALLASPSRVASILLQSPLDEPGEVVGRIAGAGLLSLGIACWLARKTPLSPAGLGVAWALLAYNVTACVTLAFAGTAMASGGIPALGASVLHGLFGVLLLAALIRSKRS